MTIVEWCKAKAAAIVAAATAVAGKAAGYGDEARSAVLTPTLADGTPMWDGVSKTRDAVVRVFVSADVSADASTVTSYTVRIGGHGPAPTLGAKVPRTDKEWDVNVCKTAEQAETAVAAALVALMTGNFTAPTLAAATPRLACMRARYVERPDVARKAAGKAGRVASKAADADTLAALVAAATADTDKPADKPQAAPTADKPQAAPTTRK